MSKQLLSAFGNKMIINPYRFAGVSTLLDDLVSWWSMDEESGTRVDSVIATGNDLSAIGAIGFVAGVVGNAADFETNEYLKIANGDITGLNFGDTDWSMSLWVKWDSFPTNFRYAMSKDEQSVNKAYQMPHTGSNNGNKVAFFVGNGSSSNIGGVTSTPTVGTTGIWYHFIVYHSATDNEVGITINDGTPDTSATTGAAGNSSADFQLGRRQFNADIDGKMDEVGVWSRLLTPAEITGLYNSGDGIGYPG